MNKKLLSLAVAAGVASSSANAVDLNATTPVPNVYASEITITPTTGTNLIGVAGNDVTVDAGFTISASATRYMRFDITGATIGVTTGRAIALAVADIKADGSTAGSDATETLSAGGTTGDAFVIYEVTSAAANTITPTSNAVLTMPNLTIAAAANIGVTYRLYDNAVDASNNTTANAVVTTTGTIATNTTANTLAAVAGVASGTIDVGAAGKTFTLAATRSTLGTITFADVASVNALDGATALTTANATLSGSLVVTGDFTPAQDLTTLVPDGTYTGSSVFIDSNGTLDCAAHASDVAATTLTATTATFAGVGAAAAAGSQAVCMIVNGVSTIATGSYSAVYTPVGNTGYTLSPSTLTLNTLAKNGSTQVANLALSPTGAYKNFIRVSNGSNTAGTVSITMYNDDGAAATFALSAVSGEASDTLAGQASSGLMNITDLMAAAVVAVPTFALSTVSNKLRVSVSGEFAGVNVQSITTSIDGNSFSTF